jgi:tetratricopeptide (TPR) repeat protein
VTGSYLDAGRQLRIDVQVQDAAAGTTIASLSESADEAQIINLVSRLGEKLRMKCGAGEITIEQGRSLEAGRPSTPKSSRLYADGLNKLRLYDAVSARDLLQKATSADPGYAPAHTALSMAWSQLGYDNKAQEEAKKAFDFSANLSHEQQLDAEAHYYTSLSQWGKAIEIYRSLFSFFPDNLEYGLNLALSQNSAGKSKDALATAEGLRAMASPLKDDPRIDLVEAKARESLGDFKEAIASSMQAAQKANSEEARMVQAQAQIRQCFALSGLGNFAAAKEACEEGERIYSGTDNRNGLASALMNSGNLLADKGEFEQAKRKYEKAIAYYQTIGNKRDLAWTFNNLGTVLTDERDYEGARLFHKKALLLFQETGQKRGEAATLNNMANIVEAEGELENASKYYLRASELQRELGDKRRVGLVSGNLARLWFLQGKLRESQGKAEEAAATLQEIGTKSLYASALTQVAAAEGAQGNLVHAAEVLKQAEAIYVELAKKRDLADCWVQRSRILADNGQLTDAEELARRAIQEFRAEAESSKEASAHLALAEILLFQPKASEAYEEVKQAESQLINETNRELQFDLAITRARVESAIGNVPAARKSLERTLEKAIRYGYVSYQFDTRLALGEVNAISGPKSEGISYLARLEKDARVKGFDVVAQKATKTRMKLLDTRS